MPALLKRTLIHLALPACVAFALASCSGPGAGVSPAPSPSGSGGADSYYSAGWDVDSSANSTTIHFDP